MEKRNLLISIALILIITSMAFASAHQMNYNRNMQDRNSNFMSMHRTNNYMHRAQQNNYMNSISSSGNSRMNSQQNSYMYMPNHRHMNANMHRF